MENFDFTGKVVLEFYDTGCLNCQMMAPIIAHLEHSMPNIRFYRINADTRPDLVQQYQITSLPTLLLFNRGQKLSTIVGAKSERVLSQMIYQAFLFA